MPYNSRSPGGGQMAHTYPITRGLALVVLLAIIGLFVLRRLYGSISIQAGAR